MWLATWPKIMAHNLIWSCWIKHWVLYRSCNVCTQAIQVTGIICDNAGGSKILWNVHTYQTTWHYIPEHSNHCVHNCLLLYLYRTVFRFLTWRTFLWVASPGAFLNHRCSAGFPRALYVSHLWQGHVFVNVMNRNNYNTIPFIVHAHKVTVSCLSVFLPQR